jgi:hypothetical protein
MPKQKAETIKEAQALVKEFAQKNGWEDFPNIDKFDHLHEELIEMSKLLRYKDSEARLKAIEEKREDFLDGVGDLFFGLCRLANQLNIDMEEAFNIVSERIFEKYNGRKSEEKIK